MIGPQPYLQRGGTRIPLMVHGGLCYLPVTLPTEEAAWDEHVIAMVQSKVDRQPAQLPWRVFEFCCGPESLLSKWFLDHGVRATRFGYPRRDARVRADVHQLAQEIKEALEAGAFVLFWSSIPCSAWCSWQRVNIKKADLRPRILWRREESRVMLANLKAELGPMFVKYPRLFGVFEWPRFCDGWPEVRKAGLRQHLPRTLLVDGCQYGLVSKDGNPMRKPWKMWTNAAFLEPLGQVCSGHWRPDGTRQDHDCCHGDDAARSANYTESLVNRVGELTMGYDGYGAEWRCVAPLQDVEELPVAEEVVDDEVPMEPEGAEADPVEQEQPAEPAEQPEVVVTPGVAERREHSKSHLPYRTWCRICVAAKGKDSPHRRVQRSGDEVDLVEVDYCFLGDGAAKTVPILSGISRGSGHGFGCYCRRKGPSEESAVLSMLRFFQEAGLHGQVVRLRSDSEVAVVALCAEIARRRAPSRTICETTPVGSKGSLGGAEHWHSTLMGEVRCLKLEDEQRWEVTLDATSPLMTWIVPHAAFLLNRCQPSAPDGLTPYCALQQHEYRSQLFPFSEPVMVRLPAAEQQPHMCTRWLGGIWLGRTSSSDAHIVACRDGIVISRTSRPAPKDQEARALLDGMCWTPWHLRNEGFEPSAAIASPAEPAAEQPTSGQGAALPAAEPGESSFISARTAALRRFHQEMGRTPECAACHHPKGNKHSALCGARRADWERRVLRRLPPVHPEEHPLEAESVDPAVSAEAAASRTVAPDVLTTPAPAPMQQEGVPMATEAGVSSSGGPVPSAASVPTTPDIARRLQQIRGGKRARSPEAEEEATMEEALARADQATRAEDEGGQTTPDVLMALYGGGSFNSAGPPWFDDVTKEVLNESLVEAGMVKERANMKKFGVYQPATWADYKRLGGKVIPSRWVLRQRGQAEAATVKARIVAQEINTGIWKDVYAATPSGVALRILLWWADRNGWRVELGDVTAAFLHAKYLGDKPTFIIPPKSEVVGLPAGALGELWLLCQMLYGLREAPRVWNEWFAQQVATMLFHRLRVEPQLYIHRETKSLMLVHMDDIAITASGEMLVKLWEELETRFCIKRVGNITADAWQKYLGKEWLRLPDGFAARAPSKYYESIFEAVGLQGGRAVTTPFPGADELTEATPMDAAETTKYKSAVGLLMWLFSERPDVAFAVKEAARASSSPVQADWKLIKRIVRYLLGTADLALCLKRDPQAPLLQVQGVVDANWAGLPLALGAQQRRRSTSGLTLWLEGWLLLHRSTTQLSTVQSSCEAELCSLSTGYSEAVFVVNLLREMDLEPTLHMVTDSSSAIDVVYKRGVGRIRHLEVRQLWLQEEMREGKFTLGHVSTEANVADLLTKNLSRVVFEKWRTMIGMRAVEGPSDQMLAAIFEMPALIPPECSAGHGPMSLIVGPRGTAVWQCRHRACGAQVLWPSFVEVNGLGPEDEVVVPLAGSAASSSTPPVVVNITTQGGSASSSSSVPLQAAGAAQRVRSASAPERVSGTTSGSTSQPAAGPEYSRARSGISPTARQRNFIGLIAVRRGWDPQEVLAQISDRLQASQWIERYK